MQKSVLDTSRFEIKFMIPKELIVEVHKQAKSHTTLDPYSQKKKGKEYTVRSIYFDTPMLDFYHEKIEGLEIRKKVRIRAYNRENAYAFLEIKRRYKNCIVKERTKLPFNTVEQIVASNDSKEVQTNKENHQTKLVIGKFIYNMIQKDLGATLLVVYEREAYVDLMDHNIRLTIDKNVRSQYYPHLSDFFKGQHLTSITDNNAILELKFDDYMPHWMRNMIRDLKIRHKSISKYCLGIDKCQNEIRNEAAVCN